MPSASTAVRPYEGENKRACTPASPTSRVGRQNVQVADLSYRGMPPFMTAMSHSSGTGWVPPSKVFVSEDRVQMSFSANPLTVAGLNGPNEGPQGRTGFIGSGRCRRGGERNFGDVFQVTTPVLEARLDGSLIDHQQRWPLCTVETKALDVRQCSRNRHVSCSSATSACKPVRA